MAEPSAYYCFTRCFSGCLRKKRTSNELHNQDVENGLIKANDLKNSNLSDPNQSKSESKESNDKGCCGMGQGRDEVSYAYSQVPSGNGDSCKFEATQSHHEIRSNGKPLSASQVKPHFIGSTDGKSNIVNCNTNSGQLHKTDFNKLKCTKLEQNGNVSPPLSLRDPIPIQKGQSRNSVQFYSGQSSPVGSQDCPSKNPNLHSKSAENEHGKSEDEKEIGFKSEGNSLNTKMKSKVPSNNLPTSPVDITESRKDEDEHNISYFRQIIQEESDRLNNLIQKWEVILLQNKEINEEVRDEIRSVNGQTRLVMSERFTQFGSLVDQSERHQTLQNNSDKGHERIVTLSDLQGFWDMIYYQVEDVLAKFTRLDKARECGWNLEAVTDASVAQSRKRSVKSAAARRKTTNKKASNATAISQDEKAQRLAARKRLAEARKKMAAQNHAQKDDSSQNVLAFAKL